MSTIASRQILDHQIQRLAAQRQLYRNGKLILGVQTIVAGPVAVATAFTAALMPSSAVLVGLWGWMWTLADVMFISKAQKRRCEEGAKIQEAFDCETLDIPWHFLKAGPPPDPELINEMASKYFSGAAERLPALTDWYSPGVDQLPIELGRIACQRSNCSWDKSQRSAYSHVLLVGLAVCGVVILFVSAAAGMTVESALKGLVLPLGPAFVLSLRQIGENNDARARAERLKECANRLWDAAMDGSTNVELTAQSRALQDELFEHRRRSPLVFDFIFKKLRPRNEAQMTYAVEELVRQAQGRRTIHHD